MKSKKIQKHKGFTLIELLVVAAASSIVVIGIGSILFYTNKNFAQTFDRVHGDVTSGEYVTKRSFESTVRKSSVSEKPPVISNEGKSIILFYYSSPTAAKLDRFTRFYNDDQYLIAAHGIINETQKQPVNKEIIASGVKDVVFSVLGANTQMILTLEDGQREKKLVCSATRHSM